MRISWLSADEISAARQALTANGLTWDDHFSAGDFTGPITGDARITEHVARAERVSQVVRDYGIDEARARFGGSKFAIEAATLAAALHEGGQLDLERVLGVLQCPIDSLVFYAPFLELMAELGRAEVERTVGAYEAFVTQYARAVIHAPRGAERIGA